MILSKHESKKNFKLLIKAIVKLTTLILINDHATLKINISSEKTILGMTEPLIDNSITRSIFVQTLREQP